MKISDSGGTRTHASEETGALNQRLRPLGHAIYICCEICTHNNRNTIIANDNITKPKVPARIELAAFCVLSRCDNHYTTEPLFLACYDITQCPKIEQTPVLHSTYHCIWLFWPKQTPTQFGLFD